jgi:hypothetical protein
MANGTFASPVADALYIATHEHNAGSLLNELYGRLNGWTATITLLVLLVAYDQCQ